MDYCGVVREAWNLVRRERGLWGLASIEALHLFVWCMLWIAVMLPLGIFAASFVPTELTPALAEFNGTVGYWLAVNYPAVLAAVGIAGAAYPVAAVLSVASQAGVVYQTRAALAGSPTRASEGLATGFRMWWRTAAIISLPALPGLLYLLGLTLMLQSAIFAPLASGQAPDLLRLQVWSDGLSPLAAVMQLISLPLSVFTVLALRFGVLSDLPWRAAFAAAWRMGKQNLRDIALFALTLYAVVLIANLVVQVVVGVLVAIAAMVVLLGGLEFGVAVGAGIAAVAALLVLIVLSVIGAAVFVTSSVAWTVLWVRLVPATAPDSVVVPAVVLGEGIS